MEVILTHTNLDFDALASLVAAQKIYPAARPVLTGSMGRNVREFVSLHEDFFSFTDACSIKGVPVRLLILVDNRQKNRLGEGSFFLKSKPKIVVYDHHPPTNEDIKGDFECVETVGATTTLLVEIIRRKKIPLSEIEATLFALGIHEDTGSLTYSTTTLRDVEALSYLMKKGANLQAIRTYLNFYLSEEQRKLFEDSLKKAKRYLIAGKEVLFIAVHSEFVDGASLVVHKMADIENADAVFFLSIGRDRAYLIARSKGEIDVNKILEEFGGGGHPQAASAVLRQANRSAVEEKILSNVREQIGRPLRAKDIMKSPVRTVKPTTSIKEVSLLMLKYGFSGFPVVDSVRLIGIISRKEVDKAIHHGLAHAPVKGFFTREIETVEPETDVFVIQKLMVEKGIGRLPVVEEGKLLGIITKKDLLEAVHGRSYSSLEQRAGLPSKLQVTRLLSKFFPKKILRDIILIGQLAEKISERAFLVGGVVRDLFLGVPNLDLDIVVEGDAIKLAEEFSKKKKIKIYSYQRFGTATVIFPDGFRLDFATTRREFYEKPGALPQVEQASLREDLIRRDFTLNTLAVSLNSSDFGQFFDYFQGYKDLMNGIVRVLHPFSFIEDPTRILRAVRFEQKYDFELEGKTEELAYEAIKMNILPKVGGVRIREELIPILEEPKADLILKRLFELGALTSLNPNFKFTQAFWEKIKLVEEAVVRIASFKKNQARIWVAKLALLLTGLSYEEATDWLNYLHLNKRVKLIVEQCLEGSRIVKKELAQKEVVSSSHVYQVLKPFSFEALLFFWVSFPEARPSIELYCDKLFKIKLDISGRDLINAGFKSSPAIGEILGKVLAAKLDGKIKGRQQELDYALKLGGNIWK